MFVNVPRLPNRPTEISVKNAMDMLGATELVPVRSNAVLANGPPSRRSTFLSCKLAIVSPVNVLSNVFPPPVIVILLTEAKSA